MTIEEAKKILNEKVGPYSHFIEQLWASYMTSGTREDVMTFRVSVFWLPKKAQHNWDTKCVGFTAATLEAAVDGALLKRDAEIEAERRQLELEEEAAVERDGDQLRTEIANGERLPNGRLA